MPHISFSQLQTLIGCPEKHRRQYLLEQPQQTGAAAAIGVAAHMVPEKCLKALQQGMRMPTKDSALKAVQAKWRIMAEAGLDLSGQRGTYVLGDCEAMALRYGEMLYDEVMPVVRKGTKEAEWQFYLPFGVDGWHFKGAVDHVREDSKGRLIIDDWKTTSNISTWSQTRADKSSQVEAYYWAAWQHWGKVPYKFVFHVVGNKGGVTEYKALETDRPWGLVEGWRDRLVYATKQIALHDRAVPSDKRVDYDWHQTCPWKRECTPWEFGSVGESVIL